MKSGFVAVVGRTSVGKSTLVNKLVGSKVSIVARSSNTTRNVIRGIINGPDYQIVLQDTPGLHRSHNEMGSRLNNTAIATVKDFPDAVMLVTDAYNGVGSGDVKLAQLLPKDTIVVLNKTDKLSNPQITSQLVQATEKLGFLTEAEFIPVSGRSGYNLDRLTNILKDKIPIGERFFATDTVTDLIDEFRVAEIVREQVLRELKQDLPQHLACRVIEFKPPFYRCDIVVDKESHKPIILGKNGSRLGQIRRAASYKIGKGTVLELHVKVDKTWSTYPERFGYLQM
jgi:GTP-binding protein Era